MALGSWLLARGSWLVAVTVAIAVAVAVCGWFGLGLLCSLFFVLCSLFFNLEFDFDFDFDFAFSIKHFAFCILILVFIFILWHGRWQMPATPPGQFSSRSLLGFCVCTFLCYFVYIFLFAFCCLWLIDDHCH